jgi:large repetitive protein
MIAPAPRRLTGSAGVSSDFQLMQLEPRLLLSGTTEQVMIEFSSTSTTVAQTGVAAPSNLSAETLSSHHIRLTWSDNSHNETGFGVQRYNGFRWTTIAVLEADTTSYDDTTVQPGLSYLYHVWAFNNTDSSDFSNMVTGTATPLAPQHLSVVPLGAHEVALDWTGSAGASGYRIERSLDGVEWLLAGQTSAGERSFADVELLPGTTYQYRVFAFNAGGLSAASEIATVTTEGHAAPAAPSDLHVVATSARHLLISWSSEEQNIIGYVLSRSTDGVNWHEITLDSQTMHYADTVSPNTTCIYRVRVVTETAMSDYSEPVMITTGGQALSQGQANRPAVPPGRAALFSSAELETDDADLPQAVVLGKQSAKDK